MSADPWVMRGPIDLDPDSTAPERPLHSCGHFGPSHSLRLGLSPTKDSLKTTGCLTPKGQVSTVVNLDQRASDATKSAVEYGVTWVVLT